MPRSAVKRKMCKNALDTHAQKCTISAGPALALNKGFKGNPNMNMELSSVVTEVSENKQLNKAKSWLASKIERGKKEIFAEKIELTPELANLLWLINDSNRPFSDINLQRIKTDIIDGHYQLNGESIIISNDGLLNGGQHRVKAVMETGRAIPTMITFGVERDSRLTLDQGIPRSSAHFLGMMGVRSSINISMIARLI